MSSRRDFLKASSTAALGATLTTNCTGTSSEQPVGDVSHRWRLIENQERPASSGGPFCIVATTSRANLLRPT